MAALARLFLLLVAAAFAWNLARGTERTWLRAKFLGRPGKSGVLGPQGPTAPSGDGPYAVPDQEIPGVQGPQTSAQQTNVEVTI